MGEDRKDKAYDPITRADSGSVNKAVESILGAMHESGMFKTTYGEITSLHAMIVSTLTLARHMGLDDRELIYWLANYSLSMTVEAGKGMN